MSALAEDRPPDGHPVKTRPAIAVDTTKTALWLETDGSVSITWFDDNVIVGDTLAGDLPPRLVERHGGNPLATGELWHS